MGGPRHLVLVTRRDCSLCDDAAALLRRLAPEYSFTYSAVDIDSADGRALAAETAIAYPPSVIVDGFAVGDGVVLEGDLRAELDAK